MAAPKGDLKAADRPLKDASDGTHMWLYERLTKAQSSALTQARTGKMGLRAFSTRYLLMPPRFALAEVNIDVRSYHSRNFEPVRLRQDASRTFPPRLFVAGG